MDATAARRPCPIRRYPRERLAKGGSRDEARHSCRSCPPRAPAAATPSATPSQVTSTMYANATPNVVTNPGTGSPNRLLYTLGGSAPPPPSCSGTNGTNVSIPDAGSAVTSSIALSCTGSASGTTSVEVHIIHTWRGDLVIDLVAPDGSAYRLKNSNSSDSADNVHATYTVNASSEPRSGTWRLRVQDVYRYDTGYIDSWTLTP